MRYITLALALIVLTTPCMAYWSTGHMIISKIAYDEIKNKDPSMLKDIEDDISLLKDWSMEDNHTFIESAVWADDNKAIQWRAFNEWHFVDTPVIEPDFHGETKEEDKNATWATYEMEKTIKYKHKPKFDNGLAVSFSWRYLIHLVGDMHQPLHGATLYSKKYPHGDRGGNSFDIDYKDNKDIKNLHFLWDACVDQYGSIWAPMNQTEYEKISKIAANLTDSIPRSKVSDRVKILDTREWAKESHDLAENVVYKGINPGDAPSNEYMAEGRRVVNEQLVVAGYRLADMMMELYHEAHQEGQVEKLLKESA